MLKGAIRCRDALRAPERQVCPSLTGTLRVPELHLRDVAQQEVFEVGSGSDFINVAATPDATSIVL
jgi:hypothetical protein